MIVSDPSLPDLIVAFIPAALALLNPAALFGAVMAVSLFPPFIF